MRETYDFRLAPFARLTYASLKARDFWRPIVDELQAVPRLEVEQPSCCRAAAAMRSHEHGVVDVALATAGSAERDGIVSVAGHPLLNPVMWRWGLGPLAWEPCSYSCALAIERAAEAAGPRRELYERLGEMASLWDSWRGVLILKTPVLVGDASTDPYRERVRVEWSPAAERHHPFGVVPHMAHGTEFPYLTRQEYRRVLLARDKA